MDELTQLQRRALGRIKRYIKDEGYAPTVREIARMMGGSSSSHGEYYVRALERKGYITRAKGKARALRVVRDNGNSESAS